MAGEAEAPWRVVAFVLVAFPIAFAAIWSFVCILLATASGWRSIAARYPCPDGLRGTPLRTGHANSVGWVGYRGGILGFEETDGALLVRVARLFPFHPDLAIPWGALRAAPPVLLYAGGLDVEGGGRFHLNREATDALTAALDRHRG